MGLFKLLLSSYWDGLLPPAFGFDLPPVTVNEMDIAAEYSAVHLALWLAVMPSETTFCSQIANPCNSKYSSLKTLRNPS